ncbi:zinc ribbon domain-containing protein [Candidatus Thorarchaeota archaeon]|nr:MAG: zinc ribbon domain-containing protein [Candidatus Thorarchaeota archaeon]
MRRTLPHFLFFFAITCLLWSTTFVSVQAAPPVGWSGDSNLSFLLVVNGVNAKESNSANPIPVNLTTDLSLSLQIYTGTNLTIQSYIFTMSYLYVPIVNQVKDLSGYGEIPENTTYAFDNTTIPLSSLAGYGGLGLVSGTITGVFTFVYSNSTHPTLNSTVSENFVLRIGETGAAAILSVSGLITVGFAAMSIFTLILSLDEFQRGILAARKMRGAKRGSDVGIFPRAVVLRRRPKKGDKIDKEELIRRVNQAATNSWDHKLCPKCGKKWQKDATSCGKCGIDSQSAISYFSENIAEYAPKALTVIKPKSKVTVGQLGKRLKLKPDKAGALSAALVDMGALQTKSVKVPLKKVAFSGMTLAGAYWSLMQMFYGATPDWVVILLSITAGLVVSVLIGYFMNFLARIPKLGYD